MRIEDGKDLSELITVDEWVESVKNTDSAEMEAMKVDTIIMHRMRDLANQQGKIEDEDWMRRL